MVYINAGHESPVIFKHGGGAEILECTGGVVGLFPFAKFEIATIKLERGDLFFSYTDGINEAKNIHGDQFSDQRILNAGKSASFDAAGLLEHMMEQIRSFRGEALQSDDITMLAIRNLELAVM